MKRKHESIDLLKLYSAANHQQWNSFLSHCYDRNDLEKLESVLYGLQVGMDNLSKKKLNSEKIVEWYVRLTRSVEITMKKIIKKKMPNPLDDPFNKKNHMDKLNEKRARDVAIEEYLRGCMF